MQGWVCTIGFFDGVHRGHQFLIRQVRDEALRRGVPSLLITFDRHPRTLLDPEGAPQLLTSMEEKMSLLQATGVDAIRVLTFDRPTADLSAYEFMRQVLRDQLGVGVLVIGYDHHFGRPQGEDFEAYKAMGRQLGIDVVQARQLEGNHVSSSAIRRALEGGDVATANRLLGRPYTWTGHVVHGHAVGRQLGFPTANLEATHHDKLLPARGAYAVYVQPEEPHSAKGEPALSEKNTTYPSLLNIGRRPTLDNGTDTTVEAHLIDFRGDLYGQTLTVAFIARLREERRFDSEDELAAQLRRDREEALKMMETDSKTATQPQQTTARTTAATRPFWVYILIFLFSQLSVAIIPILHSLFRTHSSFFNFHSSLFTFPIALFTANLLAMLLFLIFRPQTITWRSTLDGLRGEKGRRSLQLCLAAVPLILLVNLAQEALFPDIPDLVGEETFRTIMHHPLGLFTVALLGPLTEEMLFRGGVQTDLQLRHPEQGAWVAIALSAAIFAFVHLNPAQMPAAFLLGIYLGYAYWRTGSLAAPVAIHAFNNTQACLLALLFPFEDSLIQIIGGPLNAFMAAVACIVALGTPLLLKQQRST